MDAAIRTTERAVLDGDEEAALRHAKELVRAGALVVLTRVDPREPDEEQQRRALLKQSQRWPRLYLSAESEGGDLTPRARRAALTEALARLAWGEVKGTWSWSAGCRCGCSPAFVLKGKGAYGKGDVFVDVLVTSGEVEPNELRDDRRP